MHFQASNRARHVSFVCGLRSHGLICCFPSQPAAKYTRALACQSAQQRTDGLPFAMPAVELLCKTTLSRASIHKNCYPAQSELAAVVWNSRAAQAAHERPFTHASLRHGCRYQTLILGTHAKQCVQEDGMNEGEKLTHLSSAATGPAGTARAPFLALAARGDLLTCPRGRYSCALQGVYRYTALTMTACMQLTSTNTFSNKPLRTKHVPCTRDESTNICWVPFDDDEIFVPFKKQ